MQKTFYSQSRLHQKSKKYNKICQMTTYIAAFMTNCHQFLEEVEVKTLQSAAEAQLQLLQMRLKSHLL